MPSARIEALQQENAQLTAAVSDLAEQLAQARRQLDWFKRQLFGRKSERRLEFDDAAQAGLFEALGIGAPPHLDVPTQEVRYRRREKRRGTGELLTPPAPPNVLDRTCVDVSFLAGMLVDKFRYHLPLHRQHQRLADGGIRVSLSSLTNWAGRAVDLLEPIAAAQAAHILEGGVVAMDETSIKAGRAAPGKMRNAYFWPVFGEDGEIVFHYAPSRAHRHVEAFLGNFRGTLLSDGYAA